MRSTALVSFDPVTHKVTVRDPAGDIIQTIDATTTWPMRGDVTQEFGTSDPICRSGEHMGIDIGNIEGTPITVFMKGKVIQTTESDGSGYGKYVIVDHGFNVTSLYGHMSAITASRVNLLSLVK